MKKIFLLLMMFSLLYMPVFAEGENNIQKSDIQIKNPNFENAKMQIAEELNLSSKQQKKAGKIYSKAKDKIVILNNQITEKQKEAREIKLSKTDTKAGLEKLIKINEEIDILYQTRDKIHNNAMRKFDNILNKNQKKIWNEAKIQGARFFPEIESMI